MAEPPAQPVGRAVEWSPRPPVEPVTLVGRTCRVEPLAGHHLDQLYDALCRHSPETTWTYLAAGPFMGPGARTDFNTLLRTLNDDPAAVTHVITDAAGAALGMASYLRLDAANGSCEVGWIALSSKVQRTTAATEAMYLMARHVFDELGYRRYEWKCDDLNAPSRAAAERLGFVYEGTFRNAQVDKDRNRDTAWFSITGEEWPEVRARLEAWLAPGNFDEAGRQRTALGQETGQPPSGIAVPDNGTPDRLS